jgi:hypothetical protein
MQSRAVAGFLAREFTLRSHKEAPVRSRVLTIIPIALFAACAPAAAPARSFAPQARVDAQVPPVRALLRERERLALTAEQVVALDSISREWQAANDALARRLGAVKGRRPNPFRVALARPALGLIAENDRRAAQSAAQVLSPRQRRTVCSVQRLRVEVAEHAGAVKADAGPRRSLADKPHQGERSGLARASRRGDTQRAWPWCAADAPASDSNSAS